MDTRRNVRNQGRESTARSFARSISTGTTCATRAPAAYWRMASTSESFRLILGHSDIKTTQRYLNISDEELRKALTGVWERRRLLNSLPTKAGTTR